ncbi:ferrous iron transporter B [Hydrogenophaga sp. PAMC20947]|uniref:ferrous iron transporter B n=1 Tax=Hydrogenophaga sp. PAMC20947 TaxID=2565558 RepID=UPI00109DDF56|nr:ferrous iron transporter B [Hydrogenophaga sp. PAMC20947]QCB46516.1 ferrous iron transporter B [Hydrogenophaga sp. PAMC20947]
MSAATIDTSGLAQRRLALLGNPNCGKTALFNRLTGSQQKVANYAGVTVELKRGLMKTAAGRSVTVIDLPGTYSLNASSQDETVACEMVLGQSLREKAPDLTAVVLDATRLRRGLRLVAALKRLGVPMVVLINMMDRVRAQGRDLDAARFQAALGVPVVEVTGISAQGTDALRQLLDRADIWSQTRPETPVAQHSAEVVRADDAQAQSWLQAAGQDQPMSAHEWSRRLDTLLLQPLTGVLVLLVLLFLIFQAVFAWAAWPMGLIESVTSWVGEGVDAWLPAGLLKSLLIDGVIAGVGGVVIFLPQILILFFFILVMEESGYLPRAALLLDRLMGSLGLSGRAFIPLLSSFACAIPGIMAARTISDRRTKWVTVFIAPLMTCSARLPVYTLLIGAFIPAKTVLGMNLPGLVMFGLYVLGIVSAIAVAWVLKLWRGAGEPVQLMMELPDYHLPRVKDLAIGLWQRASIFLRNVGGIILSLTVILWFLSTFPQAPVSFAGSPIEYSFAGRIGQALAGFFAPIGFNWQIVVALIPGLAAREVMVAALGTVYALSQTGDEVGAALGPLIAQDWSLATGLSLLIWFVFAPQCLATLAVVRKEMGGWAMPVGMAAFLFGLAYAASWVTYRLALNLGGF